MRKLLFLGLAFLVVAAVPAMSQTNPNPLNNGTEYFFGNVIPPTFSSNKGTKCYPSVAMIGNQSDPQEGNTHGLGMQTDGFQLWNGNAGPGAGTGAHPLGIALFQWRSGNGPGSWMTAAGTPIGSGSWFTSLPCSAPWFWIVTFTWLTPFTIQPTTVPTGNVYYTTQGEPNQAVNNQNYFTGSGNERNTNTGGFSYWEDTVVGTSFQLVGTQTWSTVIFFLDGLNQWCRNPSGVIGLGLTCGSGGYTIHSASGGLITPDIAANQVTANQQLDGIPEETITIVSCADTGGSLTYGPGNSVPADPRNFNILGDPTCFPLGLNLIFLLKTGALNSGTDVGLSGTAQTIAFPYGFSVPPAIAPAEVLYQSIGLEAADWTFMSNTNSLLLF